VFLFFVFKPTIFPGVQPLLDVGPVHMSSTDIIALGLVGIVVWAWLVGQISAENAVKFLASALSGKAIGKNS